MAKKSLNVNGKRVSITYDDPQMPLLYVLRDNLGLHGPRFGCGLGQCGACTVHIDGAAVRSCITPLTTVNEKQNVVTLEGLGSPQKPHPVQKAFIDEQAAQCGYCINGMIMESAARIGRRAKFRIRPTPIDGMSLLCRLTRNEKNSSTSAMPITCCKAPT
ncbi:MAG: 2Fe-2S iron-sulfur cluster-binding protein, partial [Pseudolabrys sp.]